MNLFQPSGNQNIKISIQEFIFNFIELLIFFKHKLTTSINDSIYLKQSRKRSLTYQEINSQDGVKRFDQNHNCNSFKSNFGSCFQSFYLSKTMSKPISLLKMDLGQCSTIRKGLNYKVFVEDSDGTIYSTKVPHHLQTIQDAIKQAIKNFNQNLGACLSSNSDQYELYCAKNGKRDSSLPSLDKDQKIDKVGKDKFFLTPIKKEYRLQSVHSLQSAKTIEVDFQKKQKKGQTQKEKGIFCFCGGW